MRQNPYREGARLINHLNINLPQEVFRSIIKQYEIKNGSTESLPHPLHFNKGITGRWKEMMTDEQVELCRTLFGGYIRKMGYEE